MNISVFLITLFSCIFYWLAGLLLYYRYRHLHVNYLKRVGYSLFLQGLLPLSFLPQAFFEDSSFSNLLTIFAVIAGSSTLLGLLLFSWNLKIHQKGSIPNRYLGLLIFLGLAISQVITGTVVEYNGQEWIIERGLFVRLILFGATGWIMFELIRVFYIGTKISNKFWSYVAFTYPIGLGIGFIMLAFREQLPFQTVTYQIPAAIGSAIFCIAIIKDPKLLIIPSIKISRVTLAMRNSGIAKLNLPDDPKSIEESVLTTAAITGITNIIQEIAGKEKLPPTLGYADYSIGIYPAKKIFLYTISNGTHPLLDGFLSYLSEKWDNLTLATDKNDYTYYESEFKKDIQEILGSFVSF